MAITARREEPRHDTSDEAEGQSCEVMATPEDYDRYASECLRMAASAVDERQRLLLIEMAQAWVRLAAMAVKYSREGSP